MIVRNSLLLAFFGGVSIILGVVRDRLLSEYVGVGPMLDVYNAAFRIPDWTLAIMLSFAAATTVVPFLTQAVHDDDRHEMMRRFSSLFIFFGGSMIVLGLVVIALLPYSARFIVPGFSADQLEVFIPVTSIFMVQPLLLGLSTLISSLAQVRHQFIVYSLAPLFYTATIIYSVTQYPLYGFKSLIVGVVVGAVMHISIQSYTLIKQGVRIRFSLFDSALIKEHLHFSIPRSGSYILNRTRDIIFASVATTFGPGALSVYIFAQRVIDAYMQIIVQSISSASLPKLALHHAKGDVATFSDMVKRSVALIFLVSCGMVLILLFIKEPLLVLLYGAHAPLTAIGNMLTILSFSLPTFAINYYLISAFNASRNNVLLFFSSLIATLCSVAGLFIMKSHGVGLNSIGYAGWIMSFTYLAMLGMLYLQKKKNI